MKLIFETPEDENYFFGYYDKSPLSKDGSKLLACKSSFINRPVSKGDILEIGYFNWKFPDKFIKITQTEAWNWQQGCMLQWLGESNTKIIYNDIMEEGFVSIVLDIVTNKKSFLPMSIYAVHPDGFSALCIDNERHYWYRDGYNYQGVQNLDKKIAYDENDGIWSMDISTLAVRQIISVKSLVKIRHLECMDNAVHYIEHLIFNPNGKRFTFLHRWKEVDGSVYSRLFTANNDGSGIHLLNDSGRVTHACWMNNQEVIAWCGLETPISKLKNNFKFFKSLFRILLPVYHRLINQKSSINKILTGDSYVKFIDKTNKHERLYPSFLSEDGHPSFNHLNEGVMLSDTYENNDHKRHLFLFDFNINKFKGDSWLNSDPKSDKTVYRCDLHPKWSYDGDFVVIDTTDKLVRQIYVYKI